MTLPLINPVHNAKAESLQPTLEVLLIQVGQTKLGVRAKNIIRLQSYAPEMLFQPAHDAPKFLLGLLGWRGTYLPLLDLNRLLQQPPVPAEQPGQQVLVIEWESRKVGFLVQVAEQIERIWVRDLRLLPSVVEKNLIKPAVWAIWQPQPDELIPLLEPALTLDANDWQAVDQHGVLLYQPDNLNGL